MVLMLKVADPDPLFIVDEEKVPVAPPDSPVTERPTVPLYPSDGEIVTV